MSHGPVSMADVGEEDSVGRSSEIDGALSESEASTIRELLRELNVEVPRALEHLIAGELGSDLTYRILRDEIHD